MTPEQETVVQACFANHAPDGGWTTLQAFADHLHAAIPGTQDAEGKWTKLFAPCPDVAKVFPSASEREALYGSTLADVCPSLPSQPAPDTAATTWVAVPVELQKTVEEAVEKLVAATADGVDIPVDGITMTVGATGLGSNGLRG